MERRTLLCGLGAGVPSLFGGCTAAGLLGPGWASVEVVETTDATEHGFSFEVEVLEQFSESTPARLEISLRNVAEEPQSIGLPHGLPFSKHWPRDPESGILVIPDQNDYIVPTDPETHDHAPKEEFPPEEPVDGCWRAEHQTLVYYSGQLGGVTLEPDDVVSERYSVYTSASAVRCLPPGEYRFRHRNYFGRDEHCGFALRIE